MLATDLMFSSNVSGFAADCRLAFRRVESVEELLHELQGEGSLLLIIDLGIAGLDVDQLVQAIPNDLRSDAIAFAPHVHVAKLDVAKDAGIGSVMSRGQFSAQVGRIVHGFRNRFEFTDG